LQAVVIEATGVINTKVAKNMVAAAGLELKISEFQRYLFDLTDTEVDPNQTFTDMFVFINTFKEADIKKSVRISNNGS